VTKYKKSLIAGAFDVIHPGYIRAFRQAKKQANKLIVALHVNPKNERVEKLSPVLSVQERIEILSEIKSIDEIITYENENELLNIIIQNKIDLRILGDDYINKPFTGSNLDIKVLYMDRSHGYSATKFKQLIAEQIVLTDQ